MAPSDFFVRLQKGNYYFRTVNSTMLITPGIGEAPPPNLSIMFIREGDSDLTIRIAIREDGAAEPEERDPKTVAIADHEAAIDELHSILKRLPTEQPSGIQDIYGLDTGIQWMSADLEWYNRGPGDNGDGQSSLMPTEEQREDFKRAIQVIKEIAGEE